MTRRELLVRLAWIPLLGPVVHRIATTVPQLPPVRQGVTFTKVGSLLNHPDLGSQTARLGNGWRFSQRPAWGSRFLLSPNWRGWIENARGQVIAFVQRDWSVWGTP